MPSRFKPDRRVLLDVTRSPSSSKGQKKTSNNHNIPRRFDEPGPGKRKANSAETTHKRGSSWCMSNQVEGVDGKDGVDGVDADEEDVGVIKKDGFAPSGNVAGKDEHQAGRFKEKMGPQETDTNKKRKRFSSASDCESSIFYQSKSPKRIRKSKKTEDTSDDEAYNGVDLISESEDEGPAVEQLEEKLIIDSEEEMLTTLAMPLSDSSEDWGFDLDGGLFLSDVAYFDEQYGRTDPVTLANEIEIFNQTSVFDSFIDSPPTSPERRRVRFADSPSTSRNISNPLLSDSEEDVEVGSWFVPEALCTNLRPGLQNSKCAERKPALTAVGSPPRGSDEMENLASEDHSEASVNSYGNSSDYGTDLGETTEEDEIPPSRPQSLLRRPSISSMNTESSQTPKPPQRYGPKGKQQGPVMGSWIADPTKPIVMFDKDGTNLVLYPAQRPRKGPVKRPATPTQEYAPSASAAKQPQNIRTGASLNKFPLANSERDPISLSSPKRVAPVARMTRSEPSLMMSGLLHEGFGHERLPRHASEYSGEAFAFMDFGIVGNDDQDDDDGEALLNVNDFIDFGDDSEASEGLHGKSASFTTDQSSGAAPEKDEACGQTLLDHLDKGIVTAFRRDHANVGFVGQDDLAIKGGRHAAASAALAR